MFFIAIDGPHTAEIVAREVYTVIRAGICWNHLPDVQARLSDEGRTCASSIVVGAPFEPVLHLVEAGGQAGKSSERVVDMDSAFTAGNEATVVLDGRPMAVRVRLRSGRFRILRARDGSRATTGRVTVRGVDACGFPHDGGPSCGGFPATVQPCHCLTHRMPDWQINGLRSSSC